MIETHLKDARNYKQKEVFRIVNPKQAKLYIKNNVYPIDLYTSLDDNDNDIIVYVFLREDTKEVFKAWQEYTLT